MLKGDLLSAPALFSGSALLSSTAHQDPGDEGVVYEEVGHVPGPGQQQGGLQKKKASTSGFIGGLV